MQKTYPKRTKHSLSEMLWQGQINCINVTTKPTEDSPHRRSIEKSVGTSQYANQGH